MRKKLFVLVLICLIVFLIGCTKNELSLVEQAILEKELKQAELNKSVNFVEPKEIIPSEFLESCMYNQQIKFFTLREEKEMCINNEGKLVVNIQNEGFDPINSIKLIVGTKEYLSEENNLGSGKMRIYRFEDVNLGGVKVINVIPRGKFFDGKIYDCNESQIDYPVKDIATCVI